MGVRNNTLDMFCLSCRALGRNVESAMLEFISKNESICEFYYDLTKKNQELYLTINNFFKCF